jgi:ubiquinone/menaquinone biosynthesis C-methylase UbiE
MGENSKKSDKNWEDFHINKVRDKYPKWPNEVMLKLLFGSYLENQVRIENSNRILDIGCGFGNNLLPFLKMGCECSGVEITGEIALLAEKILNDSGYSATIKCGNNRKLPFQDDYFDLVTSLNVLHYEKNEADIQAALNEYCRILKPDGTLLLMTVGPQHDIYKKSKIVGSHQFRIQNWDFRDGEQYFYFSNLKYLDFYLSPFFNSIELGRVTEELMNVNLDFLVAVCRNKK